jgi:hypothetical protein
MQQMTQVFIAVTLTGTGATGSIFYQTGDNTVIVLLNKDLLQLLVQVFTKSLQQLVPLALLLQINVTHILILIGFGQPLLKDLKQFMLQVIVELTHLFSNLL